MAKILLCDDSNVILTMLERGLIRQGHQVVGKARDGEECVRLYSDLQPDLLLLDVTMPNKDGRECLADILKLHPQAKVIMVSAIMNVSVKDECLRLGAKSFIIKSKITSPTEFDQCVTSVIEPILKSA